MKVNLRVNWKRLYKSLKYYLVGLYKKFDEDHIWIQSGGIAFNILICSIPFTLILFSIFGIYLSSESTVGAIDDYLNAVVGITPELKEKIKVVVQSRVIEIASTKTLVGIIGVVGILWTASGLFSTIRDVLNKIYKIDLEVFYLWGKLKDIGMVILITMLFVLSFASTAVISILKAVDERFFSNTLFGFGLVENFLTIFLGLLFSFLMFYLIYKIVPHGKIKNVVVLISALSSTIMWEILKFIFTFYLIKFSNFTAVYGAYAAIVAIIFWIYYSSTTFVIGAEIGQLYHEKKLLKS